MSGVDFHGEPSTVPTIGASTEGVLSPAAEPERFRSASGLRPASAFVLIGFVLALVAARSAIIALHEKGEQPKNLMRLPILPVGFEITDASGVPLAGSVDYLELVMSPSAMWQAHTPDVMASRISQALGGRERADVLLEKMIPDAVDGVITARLDRKTPLLLDEAQKDRVVAWLSRGTLDPKDEAAAPIDGFRVVRTNEPGRYLLAWNPILALSDAERTRHGFKRPLDWSRRICDDLGACLLGAGAEAIDTDEERRDLRARTWRTLMPTQFKSLVKEVPIECAQAIHDLLKGERVQPHQMEIRRNQKRVYPAKGKVGESPALSVLGRWGTFEPDQARKRAMTELDLPADDSAWSMEQLEAFRVRSEALVFQPSPMSGLEFLSNSVLARPECQEWLKLRGEEYTFLANQTPRQPLHRYFQELIPADEAPRVISTIEIGLQRTMRTVLERTMEDNDPALVMGIAIDVATGDVLAVDAIDRYGMGGFLPTLHTYTPGSTMKAVVMAAALEEGLVTPDEKIDAHHNQFVFEGRAIHEADGARDKDIVTAAQGLAYSINAVMVQIGTRMTDEVMRKHLTDLGYARYPGAGLGGERVGLLNRLPWSRKYTQASICFGHELLVTMWQHTAALATIVRGGHYRPLRMIKAVEQYGARKDFPLVEDHELQRTDSLSPRTCEQVRAMMMLGAKEGTGRKLHRDDMIMGTKTGTAERVPGEVCLHVELQHNAEHGCRGARECRVALKGQKAHKGPCYTSSICLFGRRVEGGREVLVYVVVDEPRGRAHFGSEVAGPAGLAILREALGFTSLGEEVVPVDASGFHVLPSSPVQSSDQPWAEVPR